MADGSPNIQAETFVLSSPFFFVSVSPHFPTHLSIRQGLYQNARGLLVSWKPCQRPDVINYSIQLLCVYKVQHALISL